MYNVKIRIEDNPDILTYPLTAGSFLADLLDEVKKETNNDDLCSVELQGKSLPLEDSITNHLQPDNVLRLSTKRPPAFAHSLISDVRLKALTRWVDSILSQKGMKCEDIIVDLQHEDKLLTLVNILTHSSVELTNKQESLWKEMDGFVDAIEVLEKHGLDLPQFAAAKVFTGDVQGIASVAWALAQEFEMKIGKSSDTVASIMKWCTKRTKRYTGVTNFQPIGYAMCCLIHSFRPACIDLDALSPSDNYGCAHAALQACRYMGIPVLIDASDCVGDIDEKSLCLQLAVMRRKLCLEAQSHRPFMLLMRHGNKKMAVTAQFGDHYLNSAGIKLVLAAPNAEDPAQLFTFGAQEGGWVTVIDSWKQQGMVWDIANADSENPPPGVPWYLFMFHGRHNQRFVYHNRHLVACQNGHVVTFEKEDGTFFMKNVDYGIRENQEFDLVYV